MSQTIDVARQMASDEQPPFDPFYQGDIYCLPDPQDTEENPIVAEHSGNYPYFRAVLLGAIAIAQQQGRSAGRIRIPQEHYPSSSGPNVAAFLFNEGQRRGGLTEDELHELMAIYEATTELRGVIRHATISDGSRVVEEGKPWEGLSPQDRAAGSYIDS
jgi:hypothetical protein